MGERGAWPWGYQDLRVQLYGGMLLRALKGSGRSQVSLLGAAVDPEKPLNISLVQKEDWHWRKHLNLTLFP